MSHDIKTNLNINPRGILLPTSQALWLQAFITPLFTYHENYSMLVKTDLDSQRGKAFVRLLTLRFKWME